MDTNISQSVGSVPPPPQAPSPVAYAGFWIRVLAAIIDGILLGIVSGAINTILGIPFYANELNYQSNGINALIGLAYYSLMESSSYQATLGKMVVGIKVTDLDGGRISLPKALGRYLSKIISAIILGIGYIMVAFTEKKQGLHDMIVGTLVVKK